ncbi:MAG: hypothetical protein IPJ88_11495 [Myxococcales bacterium]|nr:MAG: hypothetical protein IPJ88_11495 [Myxococcales bacterium]
MADASRCDFNSGGCVACVTQSDCAHLEATPACDDGQCVECSAENNMACAEGANACDNVSKQCTDTPLHSKSTCQSCVSDAECAEGHLCVQERYKGDSSGLGFVCLKLQSEYGGTCNTAIGQPYAQLYPGAISIDGQTGDVCELRVSTCAAHAGFDTTPCEGESDTGHDQCDGDHPRSGYCYRISAGATEYRCTVPCITPQDCRLSPSGVTGCTDVSFITNIPNNICDF